MTTLDRADAPANLRGYSVTMWQATGLTDRWELAAVEGLVMDTVGPTLDHLTRDDLLKAASEAHAFLTSMGTLSRDAAECRDRAASVGAA
jgi:hypothetical protein